MPCPILHLQLWFIMVHLSCQGSSTRNWASSTTRTGLCHAVPSGAQLHRLPGYHQTAAASNFTSTSGTSGTSVTSVWNGEIWWNWIQFLGIKNTSKINSWVSKFYCSTGSASMASMLHCMCPCLEAGYGWILHVRPSSGLQPCHLGKALGS